MALGDLGAIVVDPVTKKVNFKLQSQPLKGIEILTQLVILNLLTTTGSDVLDSNDGATLGDIVGRYNIDTDNISELFADISMKLKKVEDSIFEGQVGLDISAEEKLKKITLLKLTPSTEDATLAIRIRVENEVGRTKDVVL